VFFQRACSSASVTFASGQAATAAIAFRHWATFQPAATPRHCRRAITLLKAAASPRRWLGFRVTLPILLFQMNVTAEMP